MKTAFMIIFAGLQKSTQNIDSVKLSIGVESSNKVLDGTASIGDVEAMCSLANKILEPEFDNETVSFDYSNHIETNPDQWIRMIDCEIGTDWGTIARAVIAYNG